MTCANYLQGTELVTATLHALEPVIQGINAAAQNPRYCFVTVC